MPDGRETEGWRSPQARGLEGRMSEGPLSSLRSVPPDPSGRPLTQAAGAVQAAGKPTGTGAHEAPTGVGAVAPRAEAWHAETLIYICVDGRPSEEGPPAALPPLSYSLPGSLSTGEVTHPTPIALPWPTFTLGTVLAEPVSWRAAALKGAHGVEAAAALAQARDSLALVHICKGMRGPSEGRSKAARAPTPLQLPAPSSVLADSLTLAGPCVDIGDEAPAAGVRLRRAELTGDAPGTAHGSTAERLGTHETCEPVLAALGAHLTEAGARAVVCETNGSGELASSCLAPQASPSLQPFTLQSPSSPKPLQPTSKKEARTSKLANPRAHRKNVTTPPAPQLPSGLGRDHRHPAGEPVSSTSLCLALPNLPDPRRNPASSPRLWAHNTTPRNPEPSQRGLIGAPASGHGVRCGFLAPTSRWFQSRGWQWTKGSPSQKETPKPAP